MHDVHQSVIKCQCDKRIADAKKAFKQFPVEAVVHVFTSSGGLGQSRLWGWLFVRLVLGSRAVVEWCGREVNKMDRKAECESIVMSKSEKRLLEKIRKKPHTKCGFFEVRPLVLMGLVRADTEGQDELGQPIRLDTYCVSDFYQVYSEYLKEKRWDQMTQSLWLPILVSLITTLAVNGLQSLWPLLSQWFASFL